MNETLGLIVAVVFGVVAAFGWIKRELWIHRRRKRTCEQKDSPRAREVKRYPAYMLAPPRSTPVSFVRLSRPTGASSTMPGVPSSPWRKLGGSHLTQRLFRQILGRIGRLAGEEADMGPCRNSGSEGRLRPRQDLPGGVS